MLNFFLFRVPEEEFLKAFKNQPGLKTRINSFHRRMESAKKPNEDFVPIRYEWTMVDRIVACRFIVRNFIFSFLIYELCFEIIYAIFKNLDKVMECVV